MATETEERSGRRVVPCPDGALRHGAGAGSSMPMLVIDDNRLPREGIVAQVNARSGVRVVKAVGSAEAALRRIRATRPRVVLVDAGLAEEESHRFVEQVREAAPDARIIVMDLLPAREDVADFIRAGASGFIMKDATTEEVINAVRSVAAGDTVLPFELTGSLLTHIAKHAVSRRPAPEALRGVRMTKREREVVDLIAEGLSNKEIAQRLFVGTRTVKSHVHNILEKLALRTRLQIASFDWGPADEPAAAVGGR